jgi:hypothetical protein
MPLDDRGEFFVERMTPVMFALILDVPGTHRFRGGLRSDAAPPLGH